MIRAAETPSSVRARSTARDSPATTVSKGTPRAVWVCGSKKISARTTLSALARSRYAQANSKKSCSWRSTAAAA